MPMRIARTLLLLAAIAAPLSAQVDLIFGNSSGVSGRFPDSITMLDTSGDQRPLAQHPDTADGGTGFVTSRPTPITIGARNYLYWFDGATSDNVYRAWDRNFNGVIDNTEFEIIWTADLTADPANFTSRSLRLMNGGQKAMITNDNGNSSGNRGIWILEDLNNDFDFPRRR